VPAGECCEETTACDDGTIVRFTDCTDFCRPSVECEGLGPAACASAGCIPTYDEICRPGCSADEACCANFEFLVCRPWEDACAAAYPGQSAEWACTDETPHCSGATQTDTDSCSLPGCVPAVGPVGSPEIPAICVPITGVSCSASCRADPPDCPDRTVAEGDGSCYTGLCIPATVCE